VEEAKRLRYNNPTIAEVHPVRPEEDSVEEISTDEEDEVILIAHDPSASVSSIIAAARESTRTQGDIRIRPHTYALDKDHECVSIINDRDARTVLAHNARSLMNP
jgi:hypothetical protein